MYARAPAAPTLLIVYKYFVYTAVEDFLSLCTHLLVESLYVCLVHFYKTNFLLTQ